MHNLFTPVEVIRNTSNSYPPEALLKFEQELYAITQPRVLSLADERKKLLLWFRALPLLERRLVATFNSPEFACMLGRLFEEWQVAPEPLKYQFFFRDGKYFVKSEKCYRDYRHKEKELLKQVVLVTKSQLYEAITLSQNLLREPEWLFELLDELQGGVVESLAQFDPAERASGQVSFMLQAQNQSKLIGVWIGTFIMKQIALCFLMGFEKLQPSCTQHRNQERQYSSLWAQLSTEQRQAILKSAFKKSERDILTEYSQGVDVVFEWLPRVYLQGHQKSRIQRWVKCSPRELMNQVTYVPLVQAFSLGNMYRMEIIIEIESLLVEKKQVKTKKKNKKKKKKEESAYQQLQENKKQQHSDITRDQLRQTEKHTQQVTLKQLMQEARLHTAVHETSITEEKQLTLQHSPFQAPKYEQTEHCTKQPSINKLKQTPMDDKQLEQSLENLYRKIKQENRDRYRKIILHRLMHILGKVGVSCKPYGSFSSQLSLPDSDLDISVDSTALNFYSFEYINHRGQVILSLEFIANVLKQYSWIGNFTLLNRAKVPLLSFSANASVYFDLGPDEKTKFRLNTKKIDPEKAVVQVDITVQPFANTPELPHCGLESTESLKAWIEVYPLLEKAIILLKVLLRRANLHKTFEGGLGSYTLSLLLIAFFRVREVEPVVLSQVFEGFASFLKSFLTEKWQIDPEGDLPILKEHPFKEPYLKHPYDGHNLLAKCYRFNLAVEAIGSWKTLCSLP